MCFSNLPVEFDEEGNPYLAEEADDVGHPESCTHGADCGCVTDQEDLTAAPERAYEAIVDSLPAGAREHVEGDGSTRPAADTQSAGGD